MSERPKIPPLEAWKAIDAMVSQEELDRIKRLSDKEVDEELAAAGFDLDEMRTVGQEVIENAARKAGIDVAAVKAAAPKQAPAPIEGIRGERAPLVANAVVREMPTAPRRSRWVAWSAAAAIAATVAVGFAMAGPAIVAVFKRDTIRPDEWDAAPKQELPPETIAAQLRDEAFKECEAERWETCVAKLDQAKKLEPAGENDALVRQLRWLARPERGDGSTKRLFDSK